MGKAVIKPIRKLSFKDCFKLADLIRKLNLKEDFKNIVTKAEKDARQVGIEAFAEIVEKAPEIQDSIAELLADICGTEKETIENAPVAEIIIAVQAIAKESDLAAFFTREQS